MEKKKLAKCRIDYSEWTQEDFVTRNRAWALKAGDAWWRWWSKKRAGERGWAAQEDFVSWAEIGLLRAASKFKPARGVTFLTYANYYIDAEIRNNMRKSAMIRVPYRKQDVRFYDATPSQDTCFGASEERRLDGNTYLETSSVTYQPDVVARIDARRAFERVLSERERYILTMRNEGHTLLHIATKLGLSRERVRTIAINAVKKMLSEVQ